jgi:uncharacterized protein DUF3592
VGFLDLPRRGDLRRPTPGVVLAIVVPLAIIGTIFGVAGWHMYARERAILNGPLVFATVTQYGSCKETRAYGCSRGGRAGNDIGVAVQFIASDGRLTRSAVSYAPASAPRLGSKIAIRYNPRDPGDAISIREHKREKWFLKRYMLGVALVLPLIFLAAHFSTRRRA